MKELKKCLIISGGRFADLPNELLKADYVIACDKGLDYADRYGITPDLVMGDFDSLSKSNRARIHNGRIESISFPKEKDDTDTSLAIKHALNLGYRDIRMICAFGNRMDHEIANIQTAHYGALKGAIVRMYDKKNRITVFSNTGITVSRQDGRHLSVFSLSDESTGVNIKGTKYILEDGVMKNSFALGQSNEFAEEKAEISVKNGVLMVIVS